MTPCNICELVTSTVQHPHLVHLLLSCASAHLSCASARERWHRTKAHEHVYMQVAPVTRVYYEHLRPPTTARLLCRYIKRPSTTARAFHLRDVSRSRSVVLPEPTHSSPRHATCTAVPPPQQRRAPSRTLPHAAHPVPCTSSVHAALPHARSLTQRIPSRAGTASPTRLPTSRRAVIHTSSAHLWTSY